MLDGSVTAMYFESRQGRRLQSRVGDNERFGSPNGRSAFDAAASLWSVAAGKLEQLASTNLVI